MKEISEKIVAALPVPEKGNKVFFFSGAELRGKEAPAGFGVRCTAGGAKSFVWFHRVGGQKHLETIGQWNPKGGGLTVYDAIGKCIDRKKAIAKGVDRKGNDIDPRPERTRRLDDEDKAKGKTVSDVFDDFVERYVKEKAKLRSADMIEAQLDRLAKPAIGHLAIHDIRRSHVVGMLDDIEDENGPVMADRVLSYVRKAFFWHATRDDEFVVPIVKGMSRSSPKERERERILTDEEIRDLWEALDAMPTPACIAPFVRSLLLCATRLNESAQMHWNEIEGGLWTIPGSRYKNKKDHVIPLSPAARALIGEKPNKARFVFSLSGGEYPFSGFSKAKREIDKAIAAIRERDGREPMPAWVFHDLRRTARSLMGRAKVPTDHAERALGHVKSGVRGTYDRYKYLDEKRTAFEALAGLVTLILNPGSNVVALRQ
jgi:integrase